MTLPSYFLFFTRGRRPLILRVSVYTLLVGVLAWSVFVRLPVLHAVQEENQLLLDQRQSPDLITPQKAEHEKHRINDEMKVLHARLFATPAEVRRWLEKTVDDALAQKIIMEVSPQEYLPAPEALAGTVRLMPAIITLRPATGSTGFYPAVAAFARRLAEDPKRIRLDGMTLNGNGQEAVTAELRVTFWLENRP